MKHFDTTALLVISSRRQTDYTQFETVVQQLHETVSFSRICGWLPLIFFLEVSVVAVREYKRRKRVCLSAKLAVFFLWVGALLFYVRGV